MSLNHERLAIVVADDKDAADAEAACLGRMAREGREIKVFGDPALAQAEIKKVKKRRRVDVFVIDLNTRESQDIDLAREVKKGSPGTVVAVLKEDPDEGFIDSCREEGFMVLRRPDGVGVLCSIARNVMKGNLVGASGLRR